MKISKKNISKFLPTDILSLVINIVANVYIYLYISKLEEKNCECSKMTLRDIIKKLCLVTLVLSIIVSLIRISIVKNNNKLLLEIYSKLKSLFGLYFIFYIICIISYFFILVGKMCKCSDKLERYALLYPLLNLFIVIIFIILSYILN